MLISEQERLRDEIAGLVTQYGGDRSSLMPTLQEVQRRHREITPYALQVIADLLDIHPVEVHSVVSFYSFLDVKPKGKFIVRLCRTVSCDLEGKERIARQLENDLGVTFGQTTRDGMFTLEWANCIGMCDQGPAMLINDKVYTRVTPDQVHSIIAECRGQFGLHALQLNGEHAL